MATYIKPVCEAIWDELGPLVLPKLNEEYWKYQAEGFASHWNFPHCIGAVDGKHVRIQAPFHSGSMFWNYKHHFSIVLLAVAGFDYRFTYVNIGSLGSQSDSQIFSDSAFARLLESGRLKIPQAEVLPNDEGGEAFPYFLLGDEAFALSINMMKAYAKRGMTDKEKIYNYRVCRARRVVENTFGILAQRWRIYQRTMNLAPDKVDAVVKATVVLHNFLTRENDGILAEVQGMEESLRRAGRDDTTAARELFGPLAFPSLGELRPTDNRHAPRHAKRTCDYLRDYIIEEGRGGVPWQRRSAYVGDEDARIQQESDTD